MRGLIRWEPFAELTSLREAMDRLFEESFVRPSSLLGLRGGAMVAPIDVYQTDDAVVVTASLPGIKPDDVEISITDDTLSIKGETKMEQEVKEEDVFRRERRYGAFARNITLPSGLNTNQAEATFENGVLTISIPKAEGVKPKSIKIKAKEPVEAGR